MWWDPGRSRSDRLPRRRLRSRCRACHRDRSRPDRRCDDRRLVYVEKNALAAAVDNIGIAGNSELGDPRDEIAVSVVDVETSVPLVIRMKGEAEQTTLSYVVDDVVEDEKVAGRGIVPARWQDLDRTGLLENEHAVSAVSRVCEEERAAQNRWQRKPGAALWAAGPVHELSLLPSS